MREITELSMSLAVQDSVGAVNKTNLAGRQTKFFNSQKWAHISNFVIYEYLWDATAHGFMYTVYEREFQPTRIYLVVWKQQDITTCEWNCENCSEQLVDKYLLGLITQSLS